MKSNIPIIALTASVMKEDTEAAYKAGMNDYITKPVHIEQLKSALMKWCR